MQDLYKQVSEERAQIEELNKVGGQFIKEAKTYQKKLGQFVDGLDPQPEPVLASGSNYESVSEELDETNRQYLELLTRLQQHLHVLKQVHDKEGIYFPVRALFISLSFTLSYSSLGWLTCGLSRERTETWKPKST